jgi:hypothetical protein
VIIDTVNMMVMTARHIVEATTDYDHMDSIAWVWIYMNRSDGASIRTMWLADWMCVWKEIRKVNSGFPRASHCIWWTCCSFFVENNMQRALVDDDEVDDLVAVSCAHFGPGRLGHGGSLAPGSCILRLGSCASSSNWLDQHNVGAQHGDGDVAP